MDKKKRALLKKGALAAAGLGVFAVASFDTARRMVRGLREGTAGVAIADAENKNSLSPEYRLTSNGTVTPGKGQRTAFNQCWGCTTFCGVRLHIDAEKDMVVRAAGNPYNPLSTKHHLPMSMPVREALAALSARGDSGQSLRATVCGRGAAMLEANGNPFRILQCLKRAGKRGEGKWKSIPFEQLVAEVVDGGDLFGEGHVDGLKAIREAKGPANPDMPEFGPQSNRLLLTYTTEDGREHIFLRRFGQNAFGTKNFGKHGAYCGLSFRMGAGLFLNDIQGMPHTKPDFENCEFVLFWGTAPSQAGNPFNRSALMLADARSNGEMRYAVIDPVLRLPVTGAARDRAQWVPILPGMDSALALGMIRVILDNNRHDAAFLSRPTLEAARKAGEAGFSNATHLVQLTGKRAGAMLRVLDLSMGAGGFSGAHKNDALVMSLDGRLLPAGACGQAELFYRGLVDLGNGEKAEVATALQLLKEEACSRELEEYAQLCGVPREIIVDLATRLTSHGKKAAVDVHGGMMSASGVNAAFAVLTLNTLIGNINAKGGLSVGGGGFHKPALQGPRYDLASFDGQSAPKGFPAIRCRSPYQKSTEFKKKLAAGENPYPSEYPWYPLTPPNLPAEHLLAHANGNPFKYKCWINWKGNVLYGHGGLKRAVHRHIVDPGDLPLIVGIDTFHNETNAYADYLVPDPCMYELWGGFSGAWAGVLTRMSTARWPSVTPRQARSADGEPVCMELFIIEAAKRMGLPGFGDNAIRGADNRMHPLNTPRDFYLRHAANIAWFKGEVLPSPSAEDMLLSGVEPILADIRQVLPPEEQGPVTFLYTRGGRFAPYSTAYKGQELAAQWEKPLAVYNEDAGTAISTLTGKPYTGTPCFLPPLLHDGQELRAVWSREEYPLELISFKSVLVNSYGVVCPRLLSIKGTNLVIVHPRDAAKAGIRHGERVRLSTPGGSAAAYVSVGAMVMPGVVAVEHGFGHTGLGASSVEIDGRLIPAEKAAAAGINLNDLAPGDPTRKGASALAEHMGGAAARQGIPARIEKI